jgi:hypothetical protein
VRGAALKVPDCGIFAPVAREVLGWPRRFKLAHAFLRGYSDKKLKLAQLLGQLGVFLTLQSTATFVSAT